METGQFYHFCSIIAPISLNFIAIKGPANLVDNVSEQPQFSQSVLESSLKCAIALLSK